jgi:hypothetical protein
MTPCIANRRSAPRSRGRMIHTYGQQPAERSTCKGCRVENGESFREFIRLVPTTEQKHDAGEESYNASFVSQSRMPFREYNSPASTRPKQNRNATRPPRLLMPFAPMDMAPCELQDQTTFHCPETGQLTHANMRHGRKILGFDRARSMLDGTSFRRYPCARRLG